MSNPTTGSDKSDAGGWFGVIYSAEATTFDVILKDSTGVTIKESDSVVSLGSNTGTLTRDFTTSRFAARGSGGTTLLEAGDPVGDDVGGTGELGGWNGTQADLWTINAVLVNILGRLKENGFKLPGIVRTAATTFSAVSQVDIALTNDPTGVLVFDVDINALKLSTTSVTMSVRFSYDGGLTFISTNTYLYSVIDAEGSGAIAGVGSATPVSAGIIASAGATTGTSRGMIQMRISTPDSGTGATVAHGVCTTLGASGAVMLSPFSVIHDATLGRATHVRLIFSTGTAAGVYRVVPQRGFGET